MKKCASCTKDLPDAALHCVFCGAKQAPAPAVQQGLAKTAFGYSANDELPRRPPPYAPPQPPAFAPSKPAVLPATQIEPRGAPPPIQRAHPASTPPPAGNYGVPLSAASAQTFVPNGPNAGPAYGRPNAAIQPTLVPDRGPSGQQAAMQPPPPPPIMRIPAAQPPPYRPSTHTRVGRPIEPWQQTLRVVMFVWGVALLAAFAAPLQLTPSIEFAWKLVLEGEGTARLPPLMLAAVGLLSLLVAAIPMQPAARGLIAGVLGLAGIAVPIALAGLPHWLTLVPMIGMVVLVPSLLVRDEYRGSIAPRLLVTAGVIAMLLPMLLPQNGAIPLVTVFQALIHAPGTEKAVPALGIGLVFVVFMSLLAWLPAPVTGGAKLWALLLILWSLIVHATGVGLAGQVVEKITAAPNATLFAWVAPSPPLIGSAYLALVGYGLASVIGKQLE